MNLKTMRLAAGLSQSQLAKASGVSVRMIQHYEQGVKNLDMAHLKTLIALAGACKCRISDLLNDEQLVTACSTVEL